MKRVLLIVSLVFVVSWVKAEDKDIHITGFQGLYDGSKGTARAQVWKVPNSPLLQNIFFEVFREESQLRLVHPQGETVIEDLPDALIGLNHLSWMSFATQINKNSIELHGRELKGDHGQKSLLLSNFNMVCATNDFQRSWQDMFFKSCLGQGIIDFDLLHMTEGGRSHSEWAELLRRILRGLNSENIIKGGRATKLEDFELRTRKGDFELRVKADLDFSVTLKGEGKIQYKEKGPNGRLLRIRIDKVKAGFFNITNRVFSELQSFQNSRVTVQKPWVNIELSTVQ